MEKKQGDILKMSEEIKHYNHNHGKDGRFTFGSGRSISSTKSHNSNVKDINGRSVGKEEPVKGKKDYYMMPIKCFSITTDTRFPP